MNKKNFAIITTIFLIITSLVSYLGAEYLTAGEIKEDITAFKQEVDLKFAFKDKISLGYFFYDKKDIYVDTSSSPIVHDLRVFLNKSIIPINFLDTALYKRREGALSRVNINSSHNNFFRIKQINKINDTTRVLQILYIKRFDYYSSLDYVKSNLSEYQIFDELFYALYTRYLLDFGYKDAVTGNRALIEYVNELTKIASPFNSSHLASSKKGFFTLQLIGEQMIENNQPLEEKKEFILGAVGLRKYPTRRLDAEIYKEVYKIKIEDNHEKQKLVWVTNFFTVLKYFSVGLFALLLMFFLMKILIKDKYETS